MDICFFFNDTATTEIYTLSLHDALPILPLRLPLREDARVVRDARGGALADHAAAHRGRPAVPHGGQPHHLLLRPDRKSTRLNSSHANISYAVFCLKKKNQ